MKPPEVDPMLFWTTAAAIGQIAGAVATAAAVIVSLWIVLSERREKLRLAVGHRLIIERGQAHVDVVVFDITNFGLFPVRISSFSWRVGWSKRGPLWARHETAIQLPDEIGGATTPLALEAGERTTMLIRLDRFQPNVASSKDVFRRRSLPFGLWVLPPVYGLAHTTRGKQIAVRIEKGLREELLRMHVAPSETGAAA